MLTLGDTITINWIGADKKHPWLSVFADKLSKNQKNDGYFRVVSHGNPAEIINGNSIEIKSAADLVNQLRQASPEFDKAMKGEKRITLEFTGCATAAEYVKYQGKMYGPYKDPIAYKVSREFPNITVKAYDGSVVVGPISNSDVGIVSVPNKDNDGGKVTIKDGAKTDKEIADSVPVFDRSAASAVGEAGSKSINKSTQP